MEEIQNKLNDEVIGKDVFSIVGLLLLRLFELVLELGKESAHLAVVFVGDVDERPCVCTNKVVDVLV